MKNEGEFARVSHTLHSSCTLRTAQRGETVVIAQVEVLLFVFFAGELNCVLKLAKPSAKCEIMRENCC
jgi:hypothetical protein